MKDTNPKPKAPKPEPPKPRPKKVRGERSGVGGDATLASRRFC